MAKRNRCKIKLLSTSGSGHFYTSFKNKNNSKYKLCIKKFDPLIGKHVLYKEVKI